jgi:GTP-binding protein
MIDTALITVKSGDGGAGSFSYRREKFAPKGGPDGGDGGYGGDVYLAVNAHKNTLRDFQSTKKFSAENGQTGGKRLSHGKHGTDLTIEVPIGTVVWEITNPEEHAAGAEMQKEKVVELLHPDDKIRIAIGGDGGRGNVHFKNSTNRTPLEYERGGEGQERVLLLELKLLADVGFVGFPNAGKSSLLSVLTQARPEVADYPFTTLTPHLGVMEVSWEHHAQRVVLADIPGLIEEASAGKGLGHQFLRHIERCRVLLYVLAPDSIRTLAGEYAGEAGAIALAEELVTQWRTLRNELTSYNADLAARPSVIGVNKSDLLDEAQQAVITQALQEATDQAPVIFSAATTSGLDDVRHRIVSLLAKHPAHVEPISTLTEFGPRQRRPRATLTRRDKV